MHESNHLYSGTPIDPSIDYGFVSPEILLYFDTWVNNYINPEWGGEWQESYEEYVNYIATNFDHVKFHRKHSNKYNHTHQYGVNVCLKYQFTDPKVYEAVP